VYLDTSVFGGVEDEEFAEASRRVFDRVRRGEFVVLLSRPTLTELETAPEGVRAVLAQLPVEQVERVELSDEMRDLAECYLDEGVLGRSSEADALHVATATVAAADLILSWNFKHIVRVDRIRKFNGVNALRGYDAVDIRSPLEVEHVDEDETL
jgi:hypothetical protein